MKTVYKADIAWQAFLVVACCVAALLVLAILVACIIAPLEGSWTPDMALGFWVALATIGYGVYRILLRRSRNEAR